MNVGDKKIVEINSKIAGMKNFTIGLVNSMTHVWSERERNPIGAIETETEAIETVFESACKNTRPMTQSGPARVRESINNFRASLQTTAAKISQGDC